MLFLGYWAVQWFLSRRARKQQDPLVFIPNVYALRRMAALADRVQQDGPLNQIDPPPFYEQPGPVYPNIQLTQDTVDPGPVQETDQEEDNEDAASHNTWQTAASTPASGVSDEEHSAQVTQNTVDTGPEQKTNLEEADEGAATRSTRQASVTTPAGEVPDGEHSTVDWPVANLAY